MTSYGLFFVFFIKREADCHVLTETALQSDADISLQNRPDYYERAGDCDAILGPKPERVRASGHDK